MLCFPYQRDARSFRFPLPNRIWAHHLRYPSFSVLAYLHYRRHRGFPGNATPEELTDTLNLKSSMISPILEELVQQGHITPDMVPVSTNEKFFSLPDEVFHLNLGCAAIAIYAFLLYRENRKTYRCTPSYKTIGQAIGASNNFFEEQLLTILFCADTTDCYNLLYWIGFISYNHITSFCIKEVLEDAAFIPVFIVERIGLNLTNSNVRKAPDLRICI